MEKQYNTEEEFLRKMVQEAGIEKPSSRFSMEVLNTIEARSKAKVTYTPLISTKGWWMLGVLTFFIVLGIVLIPLQGFSILSAYSFKDIFSFSHSIPKVELSNILLYAIGFTALFLVEVPFLKRMIK